MSTRAIVKIIERPTHRKQPIIFNLYHHHDGYLEWLRKFLVNELKDLGMNRILGSACNVANFLIKHKDDNEFELTQHVHFNIEYLYEVDVTLRTITCKHVYYKNWDSKYSKYTVREVIDLSDYKEKEVVELAV